jgi:hypothetical protein
LAEILGKSKACGLSGRYREPRRTDMKTFAIKSTDLSPSILELVTEIENGYVVRIVRRREDWEDISEEFMTRELFDTCVRTGYLAELSA